MTGDIASQFKTHGCAGDQRWFRTLGDLRNIQGPFNIIKITDTTGVMHPNVQGHVAYKNSLLKTIRASFEQQRNQPPDTQIASAVDGSGAGIFPAGSPSTTSTIVKVVFKGISPVANNLVFECHVDNSPFRSCNNPLTYDLSSWSDFVAGSHTIHIRAMDPNTGIKDPTPATLTWTVNSSVAAAPLQHPKITAIDGNGEPIVNGSSTTSSSITFSFADIDNNSNSFCTLDDAGRPGLNCTNTRPTVLQNMELGRHW